MHKFLTILLGCVFILGLSACGGDTEQPAPVEEEIVAAEQEPAEAPPQIALTIGHHLAENSSLQLALLDFKEQVEHQSENYITVHIFADSSYGSASQMLTAASEGSLPITIPADSHLAAYDDAWNILNLPFLFSDYEQAKGAIDGDLGAYLDELLLGTSTFNAGYLYNGTNQMANNIRPLTIIEDWQDIVFGLDGELLTWQMFEILAAKPSLVYQDEIYKSLQASLIEGQVDTLSNIHKTLSYQLQPYLTISNHSYEFMPIIISQTWYDSLIDEHKAIIDTNLAILIEEQIALELTTEQSALADLTAEGIQINTLDAAIIDTIKGSLIPLYDQFNQQLDLVNSQ